MTSGHTASRVPLLLLAALVAAILVAGLAVPAVAGAGLAVRQSVVTFENLPTELKTPPLPQRSTIVASDGSIMTSVYSENRVSVTTEQIPQVMRKAIVAIEDSRFYEHRGVDLPGIIRAFVKNQQAGRVTQGASTLTQQYVKNVLVQSATTKEQQQAAIADTKARKLREIRYAVALEQHLSKDEILTRYLNIALFGPGVYGVGTAASTYFGKPVSQLTLPEAATLAGLVQNPAKYDPVRHPATAKERRDTVLARMAQTGAVSQSDADAAMKTPLALHRKPVPNGCMAANPSWGQFCTYVLGYLLNDPAFGKTVDAREARLYKGGLTIRTTLNPKLQLYAQNAVNKTFSAKSKYLGAMAVVQPGTGYVTAVADTRPFAQDQNPYITNRSFQTGSTAKAFVLVAALQQGMPLTTKIYAPHDYTSPTFYTYKNNTRVHYAISNDSAGMHGTYDMRTGFAASVNTYFVQLEARVGVDKAVAAAEEMGVTRTAQLNAYAASPINYGSFTLGSASISPLDMANAYATIAAKGVECTPTPILAVTDSTGHKVDVGAKSCHQAIDPGVAAAAAEAMSWTVRPKGYVINGNTGGRAAVTGHDIAGKTGTTQDIKEAWFVGFSSQWAAASVVLDPKHQVTLPGGDRSNQISTQAFHDFMTPALKGQPNIPFPTVDPKYLNGAPTTINQDYVVPSIVGQQRAAATAAVEAAGLSWQIVHVASAQPAGTVVSTSPAATTQLSHGDTVTIDVSDGSGAGNPNPGGGQSSQPTAQPIPSRSPRCKFPFKCHRR